jgi:hypothetical protein
MALTTEAVRGVDQGHSYTGGGEPIGIDRRLDVAFDHAESVAAGASEDLDKQRRLSGCRRRVTTSR